MLEVHFRGLVLEKRDDTADEDEKLELLVLCLLLWYSPPPDPDLGSRLAALDERITIRGDEVVFEVSSSSKGVRMCCLNAINHLGSVKQVVGKQ